ncbi:MAG: alanine--tRNA ligase [bacterium]|nr:alanine--tRNA ligase [bacterium]
MKKMNSNEVRRTFLNFFASKGHEIVESESLIPNNDKSLLWINAGVTPLKKFFDGTIIPNNKRLVSCQKCIRTNDIEEVGDSYHHTFFEMLGNFSIGDYFKEDALAWAYELLIHHFEMDKEKLYMTVYKDDDEAYNIWKNLGVEESHIIRLKSNYWCIGEGPSGPDSEIFYDRGEKYDKDNLGIKLLQEEINNDRYIEIWNNVFSQYNAVDGVSREDYQELPSKNIDTGMGLERMVAILNEVESNYDTDLFIPIIKHLENISHTSYQDHLVEYRIIVDHIKTIAMALSDNATFGNSGREYVLRRLLRRCVMMGRKLNINNNFLSLLVDDVANIMEHYYPLVRSNIDNIKKMIENEEHLFNKTLTSGEKRLESIINNNHTSIITAHEAFELYDTYGFPLELTIEYAKEHNFTVDIEGFNKHMESQKNLARESRKNTASLAIQNSLLLNYHKESKFVGYKVLGNETKVIDIIVDDEFVDSTTSEAYIVLEENPFYATSGGQACDLGFIKNDHVRIEVVDVIVAPNKQNLLKIKILKGTLYKNDTVLTHVLKERREYLSKNHTCTHILQYILRKVLGSAVYQLGSNIDIDSFRFDFNYKGRLSDELIIKIEQLVNQELQKSYCTTIEEMSLEEAKKKGAMALFEDKYQDTVRVVSIGNSVELCGGCHVEDTSVIKRFAIISVKNKGSDTFRIEASTDKYIGRKLYEEIKPYNNEMTKLLLKAKKVISMANREGIDISFDYEIDNTPPLSYKDVVFNKNELLGLKEKVKEISKKYIKEKEKINTNELDAYIKAKENINGIETIIAIVKDKSVVDLKKLVDALVNKFEKTFILLANVSNNNVNIIAKCRGIKINCGKIVKDLSVACGGNGGGNFVFAQGGGNSSTNLVELLETVKSNIKEE